MAHYPSVRMRVLLALYVCIVCLPSRDIEASEAVGSHNYVIV